MKGDDVICKYCDASMVEHDFEQLARYCYPVQIDRLREVVSFVDSWISNPVGAYSVSALDGLFSMTRDKIAALSSATPQERGK